MKRSRAGWKAPGALTDPVAAYAATLPDGWGQELLGLLEGLPHRASGDEPPDRALCLLVPPEARARWDQQPLVPLGLENGHLVLGCVTIPEEQTLRSVAAWTGFAVRCVLADLALLRATVAAFRGALADTGYRPPGVPGKAHARFPRALFPDAPTRTTSNRSLHPAATQMIAWRRMDGRRRELAPCLPPPASLPPALARSLQILPLRRTPRVLVLGMVAGRQDATLVCRAISALTGARAQPRILDEYDLQLGLQVYSRQRHTAPARSSCSGDMGAAAYNCLPSIRLQHYVPQPDALHCIPRYLLETHCAVPVRRESRVLWVALATPAEQTLRDLEGAANLTIRPLLASAEAIHARLRLYDLPAPALATYHAHPVLRHLRQRRRLDETTLLGLLTTPDLAVDTALHATDLLDYNEFAALAAQLHDLPLADLRQVDRPAARAVVANGGAHRLSGQEPVNPAVMAEIAPEEARDLGLLPLWREPLASNSSADAGHQAPGQVAHTCLVIAVADPWSPRLAPVLARPAFAVHRLVVAPRTAILATLARAQGRPLLGECLVDSGVISEYDLHCALRFQHGSGLRLGQALIHLNVLSQDQLAYFLAKQCKLPFVELREMQPDAELASCLPEDLQRRLRILPLYRVGNDLMVATPDPFNAAAFAEAAERTGHSIHPMICTERDFEVALDQLYRDLYLHHSRSALAMSMPEESASRVITGGQIWSVVAASAVLLVLLWRAPLALGAALAAACALIYAMFSFYRGYLIYRALSHDLEVPVTAEEIARLDPASLPTYTVLVPLYREAAVLPTLIAGLARLDYPPEKLDIKLLLEADDRETLAAVAATHLPPYLHPVVVPTARPRGKPKACNYGLIHATGEHVVIFDAEDVAEPDQLKKAVIAFSKVPPNVACLQAKLNYYNANQNLLTRWFTIEYSMWFDLFLPGLDASDAPIPLGGTSNHFRTACLLDVGAWDPFNVTEDADLGIRLYRRGWRTAVIDSTTYEEATSEIYNWIRQRSRWVKGYMQTYLVHMRHPILLWRAIGGKAFFSFNMVVGGTFFGFLVNPLLWCLTALWYLWHAHLLRALFPAPVFYLSMCSLLLGNLAFIYLNVVGCMRPGMYDKTKYALFSPFYWALMSVAAWKGFLQLWTRPFYWEKTLHGQYRVPSAMPEPVPTVQPVAPRNGVA